MSFKSKLGASGLLLIGAASGVWVIHQLVSVPPSETMRVRRVVESRKFQERFRVVPFSAPGLGDTVALSVRGVSAFGMPEETLSVMTGYVRIKAKLNSLQVPKLEPYYQTTDTLVDGRRIITVRTTWFYRIYPGKPTDERAFDSDHSETAMKLENMAKVYRMMDCVKEADSLEKRAASIRANKR